MDEATKRMGENMVGVVKAVVRDELHERSKRAEESPHRVGAPWTQEEGELVEELNLAITIIARLHQRNTGGIRARIRGQLAERL